MNGSQNLKFKDWTDYWTSFNNFLLTLQNSDRQHISKLLEEARLHFNGMTDSRFEFVEIFEVAIVDNETDLTINEVKMAKELIDYIKIPLAKNKAATNKRFGGCRGTRIHSQLQCVPSTHFYQIEYLW